MHVFNGEESLCFRMRRNLECWLADAICISVQDNNQDSVNTNELT